MSTTPVLLKSELVLAQTAAELSADPKSPTDEISQISVTEEPPVKYRIEGLPRRGYR